MLNNFGLDIHMSQTCFAKPIIKNKGQIASSNLALTDIWLAKSQTVTKLIPSETRSAKFLYYAIFLGNLRQINWHRVPTNSSLAIQAQTFRAASLNLAGHNHRPLADPRILQYSNDSMLSSLYFYHVAQTLLALEYGQ